MSTNFSELKEAKQKIKDVVFGYIKQHKNELNGIQIPQLINYLCLQFYYVRNDVWDVNCLSDAIILNGNTLVIGEGKRGSGTSSFLNEIIEFSIFEWKFRANNLTWCGTSTIGIWKINEMYDENSHINHNCFVGESEKYSYGVGIGFEKGDITHTIKCKKNDIITMILDMDKLKLKYKLNDKYTDTSFDIQPGQYRAVVNLCEPNTSVTLL